MKRRPLRLLGLEDRLAPALATWDGGGMNNLWSNPDNWAGNLLPQAGDDLNFPTAALQFTTVNDFAAGTSFQSLSIRELNYRLSGNAIVLTGLLQSDLPGGAGNAPVIDFGITLGASITIDNVEPFDNRGMTLNGPIDLNGNTLTYRTSFGSTARINGVISGAGALIKEGPGADSGRLVLAGNNTYTGLTTVQSGTLESATPTALGAAGAGNGTNVTPTATLRLAASGQGQLAESIQLAGMGAGTNQSGALSVEGNYDLTGLVTISAFDFTIIRVDDFSSATLSGGLAGGSTTNILQFIGLGSARLNIPAGSISSYSGMISIAGGEIQLDGDLASAHFEIVHGELSGTGSAASMLATGSPIGLNQFSFIRPGGFGHAATLTTGYLAIHSPSTDRGGVLQVDLTPTAIDKVLVNGNVALSGFLFVFPGSGFLPQIGERFTIVDNGGANPVIGNFEGMPEGGVVSNFGDRVLRITYVGGDGNDIQLFTAAVSEIRRFAVGAGAGGGPHVKVYGNDGSLLQSFFAYPGEFRGGVHVATGDLNGDNVPDVVTAPGVGGGPVIRVWDGITGAMIREFNAYDPAFRGGAFVAIADIDADGRFDIITGAGQGGGPHVKVFDGQTGAELASFFAYDAAFLGGVSVAGVNADLTQVIPFPGKIVTGAGPGGGPHVKVFNADASQFSSFFAYELAFRGGVNVAVLPNVLGDFGIVTAPGQGRAPEVLVFVSHGLGAIDSFMAYDPNFRGGVNVGVQAVGPNGEFAILTGAGPGGGPHVKAVLPNIAGGPEETILSFYAFDPAFMGGVFVG
jgi:autotransporter-associated beta strand protein